MRKPRFSILTLLLLMALIGALLAYSINAYQVFQAHRKLDTIVEQTGYLEVSDPTKVYVRELDCPAPQTWRFQIYLPPEHQLESGMGVELNEEGWPTRLLEGTDLGWTGQRTLTVSLHQLEGKWRLSRFHANGGSDYRLVAADFAWLQQQEHQQGYSKRAEESLHQPVRVYEPDRRIILLSLRNKGQPEDGSLLLWWEPNLRTRYRPPTADDPFTSNDKARRAERQTYLLRQ